MVTSWMLALTSLKRIYAKDWPPFAEGIQSNDWYSQKEAKVNLFMVRRGLNRRHSSMLNEIQSKLTLMPLMRDTEKGENQLPHCQKGIRSNANHDVTKRDIKQKSVSTCEKGARIMYWPPRCPKKDSDIIPEITKHNLNPGLSLLYEKVLNLKPS